MRLFIPFLFAALATAQPVSFGFKAGIPATDARQSFLVTGGSSLTDTGRWTVGPTVEFHLFRGLSFELDALYRSYRYAETFTNAAFIFNGVTYLPLATSFHQDTRVWDLPALLKYKFQAGPVHPFVTAGVTGNHESSDIASSLTCLGTPDACATSDLHLYFGSANSTTGAWHVNATVGGGVEFKYRKFKLAPEVRYQRQQYGFVRNSVTFLAGFTF